MAIPSASMERREYVEARNVMVFSGDGRERERKVTSSLHGVVAICRGDDLETHWSGLLVFMQV
jgi:hypothetical protein